MAENTNLILRILNLELPPPHAHEIRPYNRVFPLGMSPVMVDTQRT